MSEHRFYTCLACADRPVFHGKIGAAMHLRAAHADLLERHHAEELLQQGPEVEADVPPPPYICICHDSAGEVCGQKRDSLDAIESHIQVQHSSSGSPTHDEHFVSVGQFSPDGLSYHRSVRPLTPSQLDAVERFARAAATINTVADFLTECRA